MAVSVGGLAKRKATPRRSPRSAAVSSSTSRSAWLAKAAGTFQTPRICGRAAAGLRPSRAPGKSLPDAPMLGDSNATAQRPERGPACGAASPQKKSGASEIKRTQLPVRTRKRRERRAPLAAPNLAALVRAGLTESFQPGFPATNSKPLRLRVFASLRLKNSAWLEFRFSRRRAICRPGFFCVGLRAQAPARSAGTCSCSRPVGRNASPGWRVGHPISRPSPGTR